MTGWLAWAAAGVVATACASGCGGGQDPPPTACSDGARTVLGALQRAPGDVSLEGGTLISTCVRRSLDTGQIQTLGFTYLAAANSELQLMPHSDAAALQIRVVARDQRVDDQRRRLRREDRRDHVQHDQRRADLEPAGRSRMAQTPSGCRHFLEIKPCKRAPAIPT